MIQKVKKRSLFLVSILVTGLLGLVSNHLRTNFSKEDSLLITTVYADFVDWTVDSGSACGDGCGGCSGGGCFPAGTLISTPSGKKEIQDMKVGDKIYGFNVETGEVVTSFVTETIKHSWDDVGKKSPLIVVEHDKGRMVLTTNHPVFKKGSISAEGYKDFEDAGKLIVGDILTTESGEEVKIINIEKGPEYDFVYNLEVDGVHTYNANSIRVHNKY